ncbi:DUF1016 N-terminal domain-containing protein [Sinorhizobium meliloti]|uniref:DUF1016 N-terminal domain-containing protein n=1 Tax=Rhizobium meliloti TaxID=382 RepID=UPI00398CDA4A
MTTLIPSSDGDGYASLLAELKDRIRTARLKAAVAVNQELILLYWSIGREILARQVAEGWGARVIDRLATDLRRGFPEMTGLSPRNLKYMRAFAEAFPDEEIVQQLVARLPWGHNVKLIAGVENLRRAALVCSPSGRTWVEPQCSRTSDRKRPLPAAGEGTYKFRPDNACSAFRFGAGVNQRSLQLRFSCPRSGNVRARTRARTTRAPTLSHS